MSTKLICARCQTEMRCYESGVVLVEMANFGAYKVWNADLMKCPGCGLEIVGGLADRPLRQDHWATDFPEWLKKLEATMPVYYDYERPTPPASIVKPDSPDLRNAARYVLRAIADYINNEEGDLTGLGNAMNELNAALYPVKQ